MSSFATLAQGGELRCNNAVTWGRCCSCKISSTASSIFLENELKTNLGLRSTRRHPPSTAAAKETPESTPTLACQTPWSLACVGVWGRGAVFSQTQQQRQVGHMVFLKQPMRHTPVVIRSIVPRLVTHATHQQARDELLSRGERDKNKLPEVKSRRLGSMHSAQRGWGEGMGDSAAETRDAKYLVERASCFCLSKSLCLPRFGMSACV